jgi:surface antigen
MSRRLRAVVASTAVLIAGMSPLAAHAAAVGRLERVAAGNGPYVTFASPSLNERSAPRLNAAVTGSLAYHSAIYVSCQATGSLVGESTVWDRLTSGGYVSDYWVSTPGYDTWTPAIPRCPGTSRAASTGRTLSYNEGGVGECTWWALEQFRAYSGLYPDLNDPADNGNAGYWATNAAYNGWTVTSRPAADSLAVFPPGVDGAQYDGHVAWVTGISGPEITISEMNGPAGWAVVDTRTLSPSSSVRYILAP